MAPTANRIPLAEPTTSGISSRRRLQNREAQQRFRERAANRAGADSRKSSSTSPAPTVQPPLPMLPDSVADPQLSDLNRELFEQDLHPPHPSTAYMPSSIDGNQPLDMQEFDSFDSVFWDPSFTDLLVPPFSQLPASLTDDPVFTAHSSPEYEVAALADHPGSHGIADAAAAGLVERSMYTQLGADHASLHLLPPGGSQVPVMFAHPDVTWSSAPSSVPTSQSAPGSLGGHTAGSMQPAMSHGSTRAQEAQAAQQPPTLSPTSPLLHIATHNQKHSIMRVIMRRQPSSIDSRDDHGRTPLHVAVEMGDEIAVSVLLRHGADPHARDSEGVDVLQYAVRSGDCSLVDMLMEAA